MKLKYPRVSLCSPSKLLTGQEQSRSELCGLGLFGFFFFASVWLYFFVSSKDLVSIRLNTDRFQRTKYKQRKQVGFLVLLV